MEELMQILMKLREQDIRTEIENPQALRLYPALNSPDAEGIKILWAPFDFINRNAKLAIIGVTPGPTQALRSYQAARAAMRNGTDIEAALEKAKADSSFRGKVMEANLKSLLEHSGVAERADISVDNL